MATPKSSVTARSSLAIGDVLEKTWVLYRSFFRPLILVQVALLIPMLVLSILTGGLGLLWLFSLGTSFLPGSETVVATTTGLGILLGLIMILGSLCLSAWQQAALLLVLRDDLPALLALKQSARMIPRITGVLVLTGIVVLIGFFLLVVPGIFLAVALSLATVIAVLEGPSGTTALRKSYAYIRGSWWPVFLVIVVFSLVLLLVSSILNIPIGASENNLVVTVYSGIVSLFLAPAGVCFLFVLHGALKEGVTRPQVEK